MLTRDESSIEEATRVLEMGVRVSMNVDVEEFRGGGVEETVPEGGEEEISVGEEEEGDL